MRCHGGGSGYLITAVERRTGYVLIKKVSSKHCDKVMKGMISMFASLDREKVKTITLDNGSEFNYHPMISKCLKSRSILRTHTTVVSVGRMKTQWPDRQYFPKTLDYGYISHRDVSASSGSVKTPSSPKTWLPNTCKPIPVKSRIIAFGI